MTLPVPSAALHESSLRVVLDLRDPYSYLALGPTIDLARKSGVGVDWLPIRAHTLTPASSPGPNDNRRIRHRRSRALMIAREILLYAQAQKIEIQSPYRDGPTQAVHLAWLWVRQTTESRLLEFLTEVFREYWAENLDPESSEAVAQMLGRVGFDLESFRLWARSDGPDALESVDTLLGETGVFQAPAYVLEDEVFYGRQHLPMIRWILEGRSGNAPI
jgi:2-hydroxychromene-2-carboxylate isomerase